MQNHRTTSQRLRPLLLSALLAGSAFMAWPLQADEIDHEQARIAVQQGRILPLQQVLEQLAKSHPGQVMEVELERKHRPQAQTQSAAGAAPVTTAPTVLYIYEVRVLQPDGQLIKLKVDASDGRVLKVKRKEH